MRLKTYTYGIRHQPGSSPTKRFWIENEALLDSQLRAAHRYYNRLVELDRERHQAMTAALARAMVSQLAEAPAAGIGADSIVQTTTPPGGPRTSDDPRPTMPAAGPGTVVNAGEAVHVEIARVTEQINETDRERRHQARAECGVYWGTYLLIEDAHQRAVRDSLREWHREQKLPEEKRPNRNPWPRFRRWEGEGAIGVQLQGGLSAAELHAAADSRVRLVGTGRQRKLWIRAGSEGRSPIWVKADVVWHRELPEGCTIKWVKVLRRRVATHFVYSAQFVIEIPEGAVRSGGTGIAGVDVGWRKLDTGEVRVATWVMEPATGHDAVDRSSAAAAAMPAAGPDTADTSGVVQTGELRLPVRLLQRWEKCNDLASIRQKNHTVALEQLIAYRPSAPEWLRAEAQHAGQWKAPTHLVRLVLGWRKRREAGEAQSAQDDAVFTVLEAWRKQDRHLYDWEMAQRANVLRARDNAYRVFARRLSEQCKRVVIERLDVRELVTHEATAGEPLLQASAGRRFVAAPGKLLSLIAQAMTDTGGELVEVPAPYTTLTCAACGKVDEFDSGTSLRHRCSGCGLEWDQDENAARNLLRATRQGDGSSGRSRRQRTDSTGESEAQQRRRAGKAPGRRERSKTAGKVPEITSGK